MDYCLMKLLKLEENYHDIIATLFKDKYGKEYSFELLKELEEKELSLFYRKVRDFINEKESFFSLEELKQILLFAEVGVGASLQAFKEYTCKKCGHTEMWHNYSTPQFCESCRESMARNIVQSKIVEKILKNRENRENGDD